MAPDAGAQRVEIGDTVVDFEARGVTVSGNNTPGKKVRLTPKEFDLLRYLTLHPNRAIPHRELLQAVWGPDYGDENEYLRVFINQLRKKIEADPANPKFLLTEPWVGYRLQLSTPA
jgi:two-component system KDP operon response regulator KdpE